MALRWRKTVYGFNSVEYELRDKGLKFASVSELRGNAGWYFVAGSDAQELGVPHRNTVSEKPFPDIERAKKAAVEYVKSHRGAP